MTTALCYEVADIAEGLAVRADEAGMNSLSPPEQVIVRAWSATGIISNGGFRHFYEGTTDIVAVADAFETLGLPEAAEACHASKECFPASVLAVGYEQTREWMARLDETKLDVFFGPLDDVIWSLTDNDRLAHALALFIYGDAEEQGGQHIALDWKAGPFDALVGQAKQDLMMGQGAPL